jgi:hypothetical protein
MNLFYDERDDKYHEAPGSRILYWLDDLGAKPVTEARPTDRGFLFAGARPIDDYHKLLATRPLLRHEPLVESEDFTARPAARAAKGCSPLSGR